MANSEQQLGTLKSVLGAELLAFMLNLDAVELNSNNIVPDGLQGQVISELSKHVDSILTKSVFDRSMPIAQLLCTYNENIKTSSATYFHYFCKAQTVPKFDNVRDSSLKYLLNIARDTYPVFLVPKDRFSIPGTMTVTFNHPMNKKFSASLTRVNNPIRKLFPNIKTYYHYRSHPNEVLSCNANVLFSNGSGGTLSLGMMLDSILSAATFTPLRNKDQLASYIDSVRSVYSQAKQLAQGKEVALKLVTGMGNISFDDELEEVKIDSLLIRESCAVDKSLMLGQELPSVELMLEIKQKIKILEVYELGQDQDNPFAPHDKHMEKIAQVTQDMQRQIDISRLALIFASNGKKLLAPTYNFSTLLNPLSLNRNYSLSPYRWSSAHFPQQSIDAGRSEPLKLWYKRLKSATPILDVSIKRIISATERVDATDALIDSVMVWENLFGAKQETTLRIKTAMALLLQPNNKVEREALSKKIGKLYTRRSEIVHGSQDFKNLTIGKDLSDSLELSINSFKKVLSSKKLLAAKSSKTRGEIILLRV